MYMYMSSVLYLSLSHSEKAHLSAYNLYWVLVKQETDKMKRNDETEIAPRNYQLSPILCLRPRTTALFLQYILIYSEI